VRALPPQFSPLGLQISTVLFVNHSQPSDAASENRNGGGGDRQARRGNGHTRDESRTAPELATDRAGNGRQVAEPSDRDRRGETNGKFLWSILFGLLAIAGLGYGAWQFIDGRSGEPRSEQQTARAVPVELLEVDTATVEETSEFTGTLAAEKVVGVQPQQAGEVQQILVQEGQQVDRGEPLVQLSATREEAEIEAARAQGEASQSAKARAAAELEALRAERSELRAEVDLQREQIRRFRFLVEEGALAPEELDLQERDLEVAQSNLNTLERQIDAAAAELDAATARLRQDRANLRRIRENLQDTTIAAPFPGTIGLIPIEEGDYVEVGETLTELVANDPLELTFEVPQERLPDLSVGLPVRVEDAEGKVLAAGETELIAPQVDSDSQLVAVKAMFANAGGTLRDGQFVRANLVWEQRQNRPVVPQTAVIYRGDRRFVYMAQTQDDQTVAVRQPVELGLEQGTKVEVTQGLAAGDRIVTAGIQKLSDGVPIQPMQAGSGQGALEPSAATQPSGDRTEPDPSDRPDARQPSAESSDAS